MSKELLNDLITAQSELASLNEELRKEKEKFEEDTATLRERIQEVSDLYEETREAISQWAIDNFEVTGNKKPYSGITVQERKQYEYDEETAIKWAEENAPIIVKVTKKLDKRKYQDYILAEDYEAPGKVIVVPFVAISPDLREYH